MFTHVKKDDLLLFYSRDHDTFTENVLWYSDERQFTETDYLTYLLTEQELYGLYPKSKV